MKPMVIYTSWPFPVNNNKAILLTTVCMEYWLASGASVVTLQ